MSGRQQFAEVALWLALLFLSTMLGRISFISASPSFPEWGGSLSSICCHVFSRHTAGAAIDRFWKRRHPSHHPAHHCRHYRQPACAVPA